MSLRLSGGRRLHSPPGEIARPTPSRVRLAVMNMLAAELPGCRWLDLFCGSGVMGCEALQRGAAAVVAVDQQRSMAATSRTNLELSSSGSINTPSIEVVCQEVLGWLGRGRPANQEPFHVIYADPPYSAGLYGPVAAAVKRGNWIDPQGSMLLECSSSALPDLQNEAFEGWELLKQKRYGSSTVLVLAPS
ncbi:MAG: rRNA ((966)-N(2))-methyltransferase RsmD [Cyanobacteriota bacterium]|jgi:16S rRNA (guanine(966)-N(2))-methyltransferase RsmD